MYKNNFVVSLKNDGKILREYGEEVRLPFGSEYSILLKNLDDDRKAVVDVFVDGESVLRDGRRIIVSPSGGTVELEGFKEDSKVKHKFKFIEKIDEIEKYRGNKPEDGIIRVVIQYEKRQTFLVDRWLIDSWKRYDQHFYPIGRRDYDWNYWKKDNYSESSIAGSTYGMSSTSLCCNSNVKCRNEDGITVEGSDSNQEFVVGSIGILENDKTTICLKLKGKVNKEKIETPILAKEKIKCKYCGKSNKTTNKFCPRCGARII